MNGDTLADYLLDHYGECELGTSRCALAGDFQALANTVDFACAKLGWRGRDCPHWKPLGATTYEQLKKR